MSTCQADNDYDGRMGVRISAIFVIGVSSLFGKSRANEKQTLAISYTNMHDQQRGSPSSLLGTEASASLNGPFSSPNTSALELS